MRRVWLSAAAAAALISGSLATALPAAAEAGVQQPVPTARSPEAMGSAFEAYMDAAVRNAAFSGTVLVAKDGVPVFRGSYGLASHELGVPNGPDTAFRLQSLTKPLTAMLIMRLQERGALKVTDRACDYLDDCPEAWRAVTIQQLLNHTSGIEGYSRLPDWDEDLDSRTYWRGGAAALTRNRPLLFAPGEGYSYSNTGYVLLGQIVERAAGRPFPDVFRDEVLTPLGMTRSRFNNTREIVPGLAAGYYSLGSTFIIATPQTTSDAYGANGLISTADDLLKWDRALRDNVLITAASFEEMIANPKNTFAGYGWEVRNWLGRRQVGHSGSGAGYSAYMARFIDDGLTVIVLSNSDEASAGGAARALAAIYFGEAYRTPEPTSETILLDAILAGGVEAGLRRYGELKAARPSDEAFKEDGLLVDVGYKLYATPMMDDARRVFEFALEAFPQSADSQCGLGDIALARGDADAAIRHFERAISLDADHDYAKARLARARDAAAR
jgi:D-alanyl-D-alanine carboxypeptidase